MKKFLAGLFFARSNALRWNAYGDIYECLVCVPTETVGTREIKKLFFATLTQGYEI